LAIVHQIIAEHGGFINVESREGQGTSFFVDLPTCEPSAVLSYSTDDGVMLEPAALHYRRKVAS
jgi:hypothetical protein